MKAKTLKKAGLFAMSAILALTMGATVFADVSDNPLTDSDSFTFEKVLNGVNDASLDVAGPGVSYSYAIASATPASGNGGTTISDGTSSAAVYAGPAGGLAFDGASSVSWPKTSTIHTAPSPGAANSQELTIEADPTAFSQPGIYRYQIQESVSPSTLPDGFTDASAGDVRYVDVYVEDNNGTKSISGIVMHDGSVDNGAPAQKQTFAAAQYVTKNICVEKVVTGNMAASDAHFPFTATVANNDGRDFLGGEGATAAAATTANLASYDLANGEKFWICGLSPSATVAVEETNVTFAGNTYEASYAINGGQSTTGASMAAANLNDGDVVTFTNNLDNISPTGVVMKFGAPLLVLLAGLALVVINRRNRKVSDVQ